MEGGDGQLSIMTTWLFGSIFGRLDAAEVVDEGPPSVMPMGTEPACSSEAVIGWVLS